MKRKEDLILLFLTFFLLAGYVYPENAPNIKVNCALGNNTIIYFAENQIESLEVTEYEVINKTSSNVYGYTGNTRITFPTYDQPYYNNGYTTVNLSISRVLENNLFTTDTTIKAKSDKYIIILLGGILIWVLFRLRP